jgi:hypothetical protein
MKNISLLVMYALLIPVCASAQSATEGLACFENLQAPEFPKAALQERVDGSVWTTTQVNAQGSIEKFDTQVVSAWNDGAKLLVPPVEKAVRAAKIKSDCYGKTISAVFRYQLWGEAIANPKVTSKTDGPTVMSIESQPISVTQSAAAGGASAKH